MNFKETRYKNNFKNNSNIRNIHTFVRFLILISLACVKIRKKNNILFKNHTNQKTFVSHKCLQSSITSNHIL